MWSLIEGEYTKMMNKRLLKEAGVMKLYIPLNIIHSALNSVFTIFNAYFLALVVDIVFFKRNGLKNIELYLLLFFFNLSD
jgi:hypothetical protein